MADAGNRVRTVPNERLDEPDFDAGAALIYAWQQFATGGTEGVAEGCLSPPSVTYEVVGPVRQIRLGSAVLYGAQNDGAATNQAQALPVVYNPADANQLQSTIDLSAYPNAGGAIWWTVALTQSDLANRRVWAAGYPDGKPVAITTRYTQRINFATSADFSTAPATPGTWFRMGAFFLPTSGAPTVAWLHAGDWGGQYDLAGLIGAGDVVNTLRIGRWLFDDGYNSANNVGRSFGAYRLISQLAMRVLTALDSNWEFDPETLEITAAGTAQWPDQPAQGLVQLDAAVTALQTDVTNLQGDVADIPSLMGCRVLWAATVNSAGAATLQVPFPVTSVTRTGTGVYQITFDSGAASGRIINNANGIPFVSMGNTASTYSSKWAWISTWVLEIATYDDGTTLTNAAFSVQVVGAYG